MMESMVLIMAESVMCQRDGCGGTMYLDVFEEESRCYLCGRSDKPLRAAEALVTEPKLPKGRRRRGPSHFGRTLR